ncbi:MAG TPA: polyphosphate polymerase domain-containing protein [Candidatus Butyricicoccus stercorigallinarum]|nr:polyphosphate polymerase domain-containing protein [Candidatus Butyricicoccus stercorigallinarum]
MIKQHPPLKLRHEYKHIINRLDDQIVTSRLRKLFQHDANADSHGIYRVSSLYFDTPYDKALRQKIDGVNRREKFRLRYYGDDCSFLRLEKKCKTGGLCGKRSVRVTETQARRMLSGEIEFLLDCGHPLLLEFYSKMRGQLLSPKTVVVYEREAFVYEPGNVRVTVDRNLHSGPGGAAFFDTRRRLTPVSDGLSVLEVKYDAFLPELVSMAVQIPNRRASAYSKYAVCRRYD